MFSRNTSNADAVAFLREVGVPLRSWWVRYPARAAEEIAKMWDKTNAELTFDGNTMVWGEIIRTNYGTDFFIVLTADEMFPAKPAKAFTPDLRPKKHVWGDGSLCLAQPSEYSSRSSILDVRNDACSWCFCYETWLATDEWPAAEH